VVSCEVSEGSKEERSGSRKDRAYEGSQEKVLLEDKGRGLKEGYKGIDKQGTFFTDIREYCYAHCHFTPISSAFLIFYIHLSSPLLSSPLLSSPLRSLLFTSLHYT
jgi:hypothetical protein